MISQAANARFPADLKVEDLAEKFSPDGQPLLAFVASGFAGPPNPVQIVVDRGGAIYLLDGRWADLQIYTPEGKRFRILALGRHHHFVRPESIAIDADGVLYLVDSSTNRLVEMNPRGRILRSWGKKGKGPGGFEGVSRVALGPEGNLYCADVDNQRIEKFTRDGQYLASWEFPFTGHSPFFNGQTSYGLAVSKDFVVASDPGKQLLGIWTREGQPKLTVNFAEHPEWGKHATPSDVAFTPKGELLVLDRPGARVLRFRINIPASAASPADH